ncbi:NUDIX domain-containing protein [Acidocella sp.]|uniref:NUDIX domain-containing protein n=1 Tax=Acidocella sp. TaxID=50710 RepID=UPI00262251C6|nr:NUDIX hydrolase [Acidocella sp.]
MEIIRDHMLIDPALCAEIIARAVAGGFGDNPSAATHELGLVRLPDGSARRAWAVHAADAVVLDERGQVALITRLHNPGRGKRALPGGLLDELPGGEVERGEDAARREAVEEVWFPPQLLARARAVPLGPRLFERPFDVRAAYNDFPGRPIRRGEFFTVSTQGFCLRVPGDLRDLALMAGDDATNVHVCAVAALTPDAFAVPDHLTMIRRALEV